MHGLSSGRMMMTNNHNYNHPTRSQSFEDLSGYMSAPAMHSPSFGTTSASSSQIPPRRQVSIHRHRVPAVSSFTGTFAPPPLSSSHASLPSRPSNLHESQSFSGHVNPTSHSTRGHWRDIVIPSLPSVPEEEDYALDHELDPEEEVLPIHHPPSPPPPRRCLSRNPPSSTRTSGFVSDPPAPLLVSSSSSSNLMNQRKPVVARQTRRAPLPQVAEPLTRTSSSFRTKPRASSRVNTPVPRSKSIAAEEEMSSDLSPVRLPNARSNARLPFPLPNYLPEDEQEEEEQVKPRRVAPSSNNNNNPSLKKSNSSVPSSNPAGLSKKTPGPSSSSSSSSSPSSSSSGLSNKKNANSLNERVLEMTQQLQTLEERVKRYQHLVEESDRREQALQLQLDALATQQQKHNVWIGSWHEKWEIQSARLDDLWDKIKNSQSNCDAIKLTQQDLRNEWLQWQTSQSNHLTSLFQQQQAVSSEEEEARKNVKKNSRWCWAQVLQETNLLVHPPGFEEDDPNQQTEIADHEMTQETLKEDTWIFIYLPFVSDEQGHLYWARCGRVDPTLGTWINAWCKVADATQSPVTRFLGNFTLCPGDLHSNLPLPPLIPSSSSIPIALSTENHPDKNDNIFSSSSSSSSDEEKGEEPQQKETSSSDQVVAGPAATEKGEDSTLPFVTPPILDFPSSDERKENPCL